MSRRRAFAACVAVYAAAGAVALGIGWVVRDLHPVWVVAVADLAATVTVFLFSLYDPYWSVVPPVIALYWLVGSNAAAGRVLPLFALLLAWSVRLTSNWARGWRGMDHEDWRYEDFRKRFGSLYWPVSFLGIHLFPTIVVFLGSLSLYAALGTATRGFQLLDVAAIVITASAVWIEATADRQLRRYVAERAEASGKAAQGHGPVFDHGLWSLSRHPNYFGEVLFWWGLYLFALAASPASWWAVVGPLTVTALFVFVSVPMMDRHMLERRPQYAQAMRTRSGLVPWFPHRARLDEEASR
jgi:steroid 5-alpha reductase family enzyme